MDIRATVFDNLRYALENGYFEPGNQLYDATPYDIACDMIAYAADLEEVDDPQILLPFVEEWVLKQKH